MKKFVIPEPRLPTEKESRESSARWLAATGACMIDQWPPALLALSCPTLFIDLPQDCTDLFEPKTFMNIAGPVVDEIDRLTGWDRHFFRLNSRSPKDAPWPFELPVSCSGKEIMQVIAASERMLDDLVCFKYATARPKLCLREFWPDVHPACEFRSFICDGKIQAVAEYANRPNGPFLPRQDIDRQLRATIDRYLTEIVIPRLHLKTVVVDVCLHKSEWRVLEINPYGMSDPVGAESYEAINQTIPSIARLRAAAPLPSVQERG